MSLYRSIDNMSKPGFGVNPAFINGQECLVTERSLPFYENDNGIYFPIFTDANGPKQALESNIRWLPEDKNEPSFLSVRLAFPLMAQGFKVHDEVVDLPEFDSMMLTASKLGSSLFLGERAEGDTTDYWQLPRLTTGYYRVVHKLMINTV